MVGLRYLLDTNTLSEPTRSQPNQHLVDRLEKHRSEVATSATVFHELIFGVERLPPSKKRTRIEEYLVSLLEARIPVLPYDLNAARWQAEERARLAAEGITVPFSTQSGQKSTSARRIAKSAPTAVTPADSEPARRKESISEFGWAVVPGS